MADGFKVDVSEIRQLAADLGSSRKRVGKDIADRVRKTTVAVEKSARRNAPVDTGALRDSIGHDFRGDGRSGGIAGAVYSTLHYARMVEEGTARQGPNAYLGPAVSEHEAAFVRSLEQVIDRSLG